MSRPFSYNDENFTVIGNILFVHADIGGDAFSSHDTLCTIPQAIRTRMITYDQQAYLSNTNTERSGLIISVTCKENGDLITWSSIRAEFSLPRLLLTWYYLKDI